MKKDGERAAGVAAMLLLPLLFIAIACPSVRPSAAAIKHPADQIITSHHVEAREGEAGYSVKAKI